jgi:hypothetical protein
VPGTDVAHKQPPLSQWLTHLVIVLQLNQLTTTKEVAMKQEHQDYLAQAIDSYEAQGHQFPVFKAVNSLNEQFDARNYDAQEDEWVARIATAKGYTQQQRYNQLGHPIPSVMDWVKLSQ